jgi:GDPmannose 4,6-dehydratase
MLQQEKPRDFVIATGEQYSVREFCEKAFRELEIEIKWQGKDENEKGIDKNTGKTLVEVHPEYFRPTEVNSLLGDAKKAKEILNWEPEISFEELVKEMIEADFELAKKELHLKNNGY